MVGSIILSITYGLDALPFDDPYIQTIEKAMESTVALVPGTALVEFLPFLKHVPSFLPDAGIQRKAKLWRGYVKKSLEVPFAATERDIVGLISSTPLATHC